MVIRGRPRGGPPPEVSLALSSVTAPRIARRANPANPADPGIEEEPYGWEAREFLRWGENGSMERKKMYDGSVKSRAGGRVRIVQDCRRCSGTEGWSKTNEFCSCMV